MANTHIYVHVDLFLKGLDQLPNVVGMSVVLHTILFYLGHGIVRRFALFWFDAFYDRGSF